jgi:hypothetical protein
MKNMAIRKIGVEMIDLKQYQSQGLPLYKGIPIENLTEVQAHFRKTITGIRYIFRGPRYDSMRCSTRKRDAHSFDIYRK